MNKSKLLFALSFATAVMFASQAQAQDEIGAVNTNIRIGKNDQIVTEVFDDPRVRGVSCYVSRARTGGVSAYLGMAEDTSDASIACRQVADKIVFIGKVPTQGDVFTAKSSVLFKKLHVVRMVDKKRNTLVYMTYSDKLIDGSPKNSVTAVPVPSNNPIPLE